MHGTTMNSIPREIETVEALLAYLDRCPSLRGTVLQGLDLRSHGARLLDSELTGSVFLGCTMGDELQRTAMAAGALILPRLSGLPYDPYRSQLYDVPELYAGYDPDRPETYADTLDARVYAHYRKQGGDAAPSILEALAQRLHDFAISDALYDLLETTPRRVVAIMGGHALSRASADYARVARIARALAERGFFLASGGGPGAMEATHLGVWFAHRPDSELDGALSILSGAPRYSDREWLARAFEVRARFPRTDLPESLAIPTWLYGHEPPNAFASHVAKYFANSAREDGLVTIAKHGIIYAPGGAGTIQEIFQDACQNHYQTVGPPSPMVFLGEGYYKWKLPVFPLLAQLAAGREYAGLLTITDDEHEVVRAIEAHAATRAV